MEFKQISGGEDGDMEFIGVGKVGNCNVTAHIKVLNFNKEKCQEIYAQTMGDAILKKIAADQSKAG